LQPPPVILDTRKLTKVEPYEKESDLVIN